MVNDGQEYDHLLPVLGNLPDDWKILAFGDVLAGGPRNGIYKKKEFHGRGTKVVNMGELFAHPRLFDVDMKRVEISPEELKKSGLQRDDLLFARRSLVAEGAGKCCIVCQVDEPTTFESSIIRVRPNPALANGHFFYYLFSSTFGKYLLQTIRRTVAVSGITGSDLVTLNVPVPPLAIQIGIANVLSRLDDKIELNRRMNVTLEAMAREVFKAWFVDFEPVHAKAAGASHFPGMPQPLFDSLPTTFIDSERGPIPDGWCVGELGDVMGHPRRTIRPTEMDEATCYIGLEHMPQKSISLCEWGNGMSLTSNKHGFEKGEILFGKLRPYFHKVGIAPVDGVCSTDVVVVRPHEDWFGFVLFQVSSEEFVAYTNAASTGTKMPRTNWKDMSRYRVVMPHTKFALEYNDFTLPIASLIVELNHQSRTLAEIRDTLLPKLISGELRVPDAEAMVEDAT